MSNENVDNSSTVITNDAGGTPTRRSGKWAKYKRKYNKEWEYEDDLKDWVRSVPLDNTKAYCAFCKCDMRAHHSDLKSHCRTSKHKKNTARIEDIDELYEPLSFVGTNNAETSLTDTRISVLLTVEHPELQGKVVLVTGASSGIGQAIAINLAKSGAKVCLAARRREKLSEAKRKIADLGGFAEIFSLDVTDRRQFASVVEEIEERIGPIDILVNNAGVMYYTHMHNVMMDDWDWMIEVNCRGVTNGIGTVLPGMLKRGSGHIINTSSDAGRRGFAGLAVYSGTKFFVEGLSQGLRQEVKGKGIKVTCIQPGDVKTELLSHTNDFEAKEEYDGSEGCKILDPDDIGRAVLYAVTQPDHVGVNEILIEPKENPI